MKTYSAEKKGFYDTGIHTTDQIPPDAVELSDIEYQTLMAGQADGKQIVPDISGKPTLEDKPPRYHIKIDGEWVLDLQNQFPAIKQMYIDAIQNHMDATAQSYGYDGVLSAASYAVSNNEKYHVEGQAFLTWRDRCWLEGFDILQSYLGGSLASIPTVAEFIAMLPKLNIPTP